MLGIERHYIDIGDRLVHYRAAGHGPPIILIHQSPKTSEELVPLIHALSGHNRVIAPDTPGYGLSDPLNRRDKKLSIDDFVDALAELIDALGLTKPGIFGSHSGAIMGVRLAIQHPDKVGCLIANGILINTAKERAELADNYFPRFEPQWDGSHLSELWSRIKDQHIFYPWYQRTTRYRINWPASNQDYAKTALDLLEAGDFYIDAYRAVLTYDISPDLQKLALPTCLLVAKTDALSQYVEHYPTLTKHTKVELVEGPDDITDAAAQYFRSNMPSTAGTASKHPGAVPSKQFVTLDDGIVHVESRAVASQKGVILVLHELGECGALALASVSPHYPETTLIAPDLPGHGETEHPAVTPYQVASTLGLLIDALNIDEPITIIGFSQSYAYGEILADLIRQPSVRLIAFNQDKKPCESRPPTYDNGGYHSLQADTGGAYLHLAWHTLRDRLIATYDAIESNDPEFSYEQPLVLQRQLIALLKASAALPRMQRMLQKTQIIA